MKTWFTAVSSFALGVGALAMVTSMSERPVVGKEPRFVQLRMEDLNEQQRPLAEEIMKISSVGIGGPYNALLRSPVMAERMFKLLDYLRFNSSPPRKLNELQFSSFPVSGHRRSSGTRIIRWPSRPGSPRRSRRISRRVNAPGGCSPTKPRLMIF
jgi:hypothetical protein